jgi:hypothetical protein
MFCLVAIIAAAGAGAGARAAGDPPPAADAAAGAAAMPAVPPPAAPVPAAQTPPAATDAAEPAAVVTPVAEPGAPPLPTAPPATQAERNLDERIQDVKGDVIQLNRDLLVLEEELLFPANTQVAVFVSVDVGTFFDLDSVQVKLDDKEVANYLYTPAEIAAFHRGGVQRVYLGNLRAGSHELVAFFTGKGPHDRDYRRGTTLKFDKTTDPKYIELQIKDSTGALQPEFAVKVWQ